MDETTRRALERMREMDSSAVNAEKRIMLERMRETDSSALNAEKRIMLERMRETDSSALNVEKRMMLERTREMDSSALNVEKRMMLERTREMDSSVLNMHKRAMMGIYESLPSRAAMDAVRNMPDFSKPAFDALKDLQLNQSRIFAQALGATSFLDTSRESERQIATMFRHERTAMLNAINAATHPRYEQTAILEAIKSATFPRFDPILESLKTFDRMNLAQLGSIAGSARLAALSFTNPALESAFSASSFASTVAESMRSALQATTLDASMFEGLEELIEEKVAGLPRNKITAQGLYKIIFDIVVVFLALAQVAGAGYQIYDGKRSESEQAKLQIETAAKEDQRNVAILQFLEQIAENTAKLVPNNDTGKYYVVERQATLRVKPNNKSGKIVILFPNQEVLLVQDNHQWIYIQYFDYLEGLPRYGWAMKKYLKRKD